MPFYAVFFVRLGGFFCGFVWSFDQLVGFWFCFALFFHHNLSDINLKMCINAKRKAQEHAGGDRVSGRESSGVARSGASAGGCGKDGRTDLRPGFRLSLTRTIANKFIHFYP